MAAPVRKIIIDQDATFPSRWKTNGAAFLFQQRIYFSNFNAATLTTNFDLTGFPGGVLIEGSFFLLNTEFSGGAAATATISAGTTASPAAYVVATNVFTGAGATPTAPLPIVGLTIVPGTFLNQTTPLAAGTIRIQLITTVGNTNVLTKGVIDYSARLRAPFYRAK
jgi:hypothetical protein